MMHEMYHDSNMQNDPRRFCKGRCVAFWSRDSHGHLDAAAWHGGAAVTAVDGKWTLQMLGGMLGPLGVLAFDNMLASNAG